MQLRPVSEMTHILKLECEERWGAKVSEGWVQLPKPEASRLGLGLPAEAPEKSSLGPPAPSWTPACIPASAPVTTWIPVSLFPT